MMIFVPTRKIGEALQRYLRDRGLETPFYHSQLASAWEREQLVKRFVGESRPIVDRIICTSAFGMGLDVSDASEWLFIGSIRRRSKTTYRSSVERDATGEPVRRRPSS